jgi:hypothetical protein
MAYSENRKNSRHRCNAPIKFSYFNKDDYFNGNIVNYCNRGVYMESEMAPTVGSTIFMRRIGQPADEKAHMVTNRNLRTLAIARIKWCRKLSKHDEKYGIGVQYYGPAY